MIRPYRGQDSEGVEAVFWLTSSIKEFSSEDRRKIFLWKYLGFYLNNVNTIKFVVEIDSKIKGYIVGSALPRSELLDSTPILKIFSHKWSQFPAHLHINMSPELQGKGWGGRLLAAFEKEIIKQGVCGVHLLTAPDSRNVSFYERNGYVHRELREGVLFLGKSL